MKGSNVIKANGLTPVTYADVCFKVVLGVCSEESGIKRRAYKAIAVTMEDNGLDPNSSNLEDLLIRFSQNSRNLCK